MSKVALIAACVIGSAGVVAAHAGTSDGSAFRGHHHERAQFHKHRAAGAPLASVIRKLELSDTQRQSVKSVIESSAAQRRALRKEMRAVMKAARSTMPDDPGYPALVEKRKQLASASIQHRSDMDVQIYSLLTEEQKAQVPQLIEDMKASTQERRKHRRGSKEGKRRFM